MATTSVRQWSAGRAWEERRIYSGRCVARRVISSRSNKRTAVTQFAAAEAGCGERAVGKEMQLMQRQTSVHFQQTQRRMDGRTDGRRGGAAEGGVRQSPRGDG